MNIKDFNEYATIIYSAAKINFQEKEKNEAIVQKIGKEFVFQVGRDILEISHKQNSMIVAFYTSSYSEWKNVMEKEGWTNKDANSWAEPLKNTLVNFLTQSKFKWEVKDECAPNMRVSISWA